MIDATDREVARELIVQWIGHAPCMPSDPWWARQEQLATALAAARKAGREEAAQLAFDCQRDDGNGQTYEDPQGHVYSPAGTWNDACCHVAAAIRALPDTGGEGEG